MDIYPCFLWVTEWWKNDFVGLAFVDIMQDSTWDNITSKIRTEKIFLLKIISLREFTLVFLFDSTKTQMGN